MALDGLERALKARFRRHHKVHLVRYADDFIITGVSAALLADEVLTLVEQFLMERGLTLSREKTQIVHIETGFDFLGFNVRKYHGKLAHQTGGIQYRRGQGQGAPDSEDGH